MRALISKLGVKPRTRLTIVNAPANYLTLLGPLPPLVELKKTLAGSADFIHFFTTRRRQVEQKFAALKKALAKDGMLWISWPKGSSGVATDLNENMIREIGLAHGLVDVKVCAIDAVWSGLKFVYRLRDRSDPSASLTNPRHGVKCQARMQP